MLLALNIFSLLANGSKGGQINGLWTVRKRSGAIIELGGNDHGTGVDRTREYVEGMYIRFHET